MGDWHVWGWGIRGIFPVSLRSHEVAVAISFPLVLYGEKESAGR